MPAGINPIAETFLSRLTPISHLGLQLPPALTRQTVITRTAVVRIRATAPEQQRLHHHQPGLLVVRLSSASAKDSFRFPKEDSYFPLGKQQKRTERISESQRIDYISVKKRALADIAAKHLHAFVARLLHDVALMLATLGSRGSKASAQRMAAELFGSEAGMSNVALDDQGDGSIAKALGANFPALRDRPENRTLLDARKF